MKHRSTSIALIAIVALVLMVAGTGAALASNPNAGCNQTPYDNPSGSGANHSGSYDDTCTGAPSGNGNGNGNATGKPCAGCVGQADEKNPPGQAPDGSDSNSGYECDSNSGVGKTNPAHTGCTPAVTPTPTPTPTPSPGGTPGSEVLGEKFLATTGAPIEAPLAAGLVLLAIGFTLRRRSTRTA